VCVCVCVCVCVHLDRKIGLELKVLCSY